MVTLCFVFDVNLSEWTQFFFVLRWTYWVVSWCSGMNNKKSAYNKQKKFRNTENKGQEIRRYSAQNDERAPSTKRFIMSSSFFSLLLLFPPSCVFIHLRCAATRFLKLCAVLSFRVFFSSVSLCTPPHR